MSVWGKIRRAFSASPRQFNYESKPYNALIKGMFGQLPNGKWGFNTRADAMQIPAIRKGRNLICGSIATLPMEAVNERFEVLNHPLLRQLDPNVANVVVMAQTVEDLLFDAIAWWEVVERTADGYPSSIVRHETWQVTTTPPPGYNAGYLPSGETPEGVLYMNGKPVPFRDVIRIDSPNPPLLRDAERTVRRAIATHLAAEMYASEPRAQGWFSSSDPAVDPFEDDEEGVVALLDEWANARRQRVTAYVPAGLEYNESQQPTPADLQLVQLQERVDKDLANLIGIDTEEVGVSTTSRTYQNDVDRRKNRVIELYGPLMAAIAQRLSMPDVTKRNVTVRFNLDDFLRADPKTRVEVQQMYHDMGVMSTDYIARIEQLPPDAAPPPDEMPKPAGTPVSPATVAEINSAAPRAIAGGQEGT